MKNAEISIVTTFYNEEQVLMTFAQRVKKALEPLNLTYELIFVNDSSTDTSMEIVRNLSHADKRIKCITTSRRFGVEQCLIAGLEYSSGECAVIMESDLQDPPELIPELVKAWKNGMDIVHTTRIKREGENPVKMWITKCAYRMISSISNIKIPNDTGLFKLFSKRAVNEILKLKEKELYIRGLSCWVGFKQTQIKYERQKRFAGKTHMPLYSAGPIKAFIAGIIAFSNWPIHAMLFAGLVLLTSGLIMMILFLFLQSVLVNAAAILFIILLILCMLVMIGAQFLCSGIIGLYIVRIIDETRNRPRYIVSELIGFEDMPVKRL